MTNTNTNQELLSAIEADEHTSNIADIAQIAPDAKGNDTVETVGTPMIPDEMYRNLPELLKRACEVFEGRERDVFLTAALPVLSGCFSNISGVYDQKKVYANLFSMIVADAACGKGAATFAKPLASKVHDEMMASSQRTNSSGKPTPQMLKLLFMPANSSSAALNKHLENSGGAGIIFESEIDTLTNTLGQEWAGYSDLLRKAFHHEPVSYSRKMNNEYAEIKVPKPAIVLTGTPGQAVLLLQSTENGLFSRFIFYAFSVPAVWKDVSPGDKPNLTDHFEHLSDDVLEMVNSVKATEITFEMTGEQWATLNTEFGQRLDQVAKYDKDAVSSVKRLGLITFRIAMLLTLIRAIEAGNGADTITCQDADFNSAMILSGVYLEHALYVMESLPKSASLQPITARFYDALPNEFTRAEAVRIGIQMGLSEHTADNYLKRMTGKQLDKTKHGTYKKR